VLNGWLLQRGYVLVRRGNSLVSVKIAEAESAPTTRDAERIEATYEGKTFDEWVQFMRTERKPESVIDAMLALVALAEGERIREAATVILEEAKRHGSIVKQGPAGVRQAAVYALQRLKYPAPLAVLIDALKQDDAEARLYALHVLSRQPRPLRHGGVTLPGTVVSEEHARRAVPAILEASHDPNPQVRVFAVSLASQLDPQRDEVQQRLRDALDDSKLSVVTNAALQLAEIDPQAERLPEVLDRIMREQEDLDTRVRAAEFLARITPEAEGLVDVLKDAVERGDGEMRNRAIVAMKHMGPVAAPAAPVLLRFLPWDPATSPFVPVRRGARGLRGFNANTEMFRIHRDTTERDGPDSKAPKSVMHFAVEALGAMGPAAASPDVIAALKRTEETAALYAEAEPLAELAEAATAALRRNPGEHPEEPTEPDVPDTPKKE
jgi:hypothetical protein